MTITFSIFAIFVIFVIFAIFVIFVVITNYFIFMVASSYLITSFIIKSPTSQLIKINHHLFRILIPTFHLYIPFLFLLQLFQVIQQSI